MNKYVCMVTLLCIMSGSAVFAADVMPVRPGVRPTNGMLIFLANTEKRLGPIASHLLVALKAGNGPIVTSGSLLSVVRVPQERKKFDPQEIGDIFTEIKRELASLPNDENNKVVQGLWQQESNLIVMVAGFSEDDARDWVIKEVSEELYLLIPKKYIEQKGLSIKSVEAAPLPKEPTITVTPSELPHAVVVPTEAEKVLGLQVNHMQTVTLAEIKRKESKLSELSLHFVQNLSHLFVVNGQYEKEQVPPAWAFYLDGHGLLHYVIGGFLLKDMRAFLDFAATKITTKVVVYSSCYAGGLNEEALYLDAEWGITKAYPFTIISCALTDAPMLIPSKISREVKDGRLEVVFKGKFTEFLQKIKADDIGQYREAIQSIIDQKAENIHSVARIKLPGTTWFSPLDADAVVSIHTVMAKTRKKPLSLATFFGKRGRVADPQGVLLYTPGVPFTLHIDTRRCPAFVSMIPGNALHILQEITSEHCSVDDIVNKFLMYKLKPYKIFIIDSITAPFAEGMQRVFGADHGTVTNVVIVSSAEGDRVLCMYGDTLYRLYKAGPKQVTKDEQKKYYQKLLSDAVENPRRFFRNKEQKETASAYVPPADSVYNVPIDAVEEIERFLQLKQSILRGEAAEF